MLYETRTFRLPIKTNAHYTPHDVTVRAQIDMDGILEHLTRRAVRSVRGLATVDSGRIRVKVVAKKAVNA